MQTIDYPSEYFSPRDVLECGQIFRFYPYREGYKVYSKNKACYIYTRAGKTIVKCCDADYFYKFFDLDRDYSAINRRAKDFNVPLLTCGAERGKGLRLLNQDAEEMIYSFIISQNNNIPRIKSIIERICNSLGEELDFMGETFYTFPSTAALASKPAEFYRALGAGYRDKYIVKTSSEIAKHGIDRLYPLSTASLKKELLSFSGIGPKVADCIELFGFGRHECFPVDTWIEKTYREDFGGRLNSREKINEYFCTLFKEDAGYMQQYLFYAKREKL